MVEAGGLGGSRRARVVVAGDRVQQLGARALVELRRPLLDKAQAEMDVTEQPALLGDLEPRARLQLAGTADVVQQRCAEQEIGAQPRMKLHELPADRRDADRVLEQPAGIDVMRLR